MMKKIYLSLGVLLFVGAISWGTTGAFFTDSESTGDNRLKAATLSIDAIRDPQGAVPATFENLQPGEARDIRIDVKNSGNIPVHVRFSHTGGWDFPTANPGYFVVNRLERFVDTDSSWLKINAGDTIAKGTFVEYAISPETETVAIAPGETIRLRVAISLDPRAGNEFQGRSYTATFRIDAKQTAEGAPWPAPSEPENPDGGNGGGEPQPTTPVITAVFPVSVAQGGLVTISGTNLLSTVAYKITVDGPSAFSFLRPAVDGKFTVAVPSATLKGTYTVRVTDPENRASNAVLLTVTEAPIPVVLTSATPNSGLPGATITLTGSGFSTTASNKVIFKKVGGIETRSLAATSANGTTISVAVPTLPAGRYDVSVVTAQNSVSAPIPFEISAAPLPTSNIIRATPATVTAAVGQEFTFALAITEGTDINAIAADLTFDPAILEYKKTEAGSFLTEQGTVFATPLSSIATPGHLVASVARFASRGVTGSGDLALFTFARKSAGATTIQFSQNAVGILDGTNPIRFITGNGWEALQVK